MILNYTVNQIKGSVKLIKELADLYFLTFNERMKLGCGACYNKAYIRLKQELKMENVKKEEQNFVLKVSSIREFNGSISYNNDNLTDEVAIAYLKKNINRLKQFSKVPENLEELLSDKPVKKTFKNKEKKVVKPIEKEVTEK